MLFEKGHPANIVTKLPVFSGSLWWRGHSLFALLYFIPDLVLAGGSHPGYKNTFSFPNALPGQVIEVEKVFDPKTGSLQMISHSPYIQSASELVKLEQEEQKLVRKKYGALANPLMRDKIEALKAGEAIDVVITLKEPEGIVYLDKTKHTEDELRQQSISLTTLQPVISIPLLLARHGIKSKVIYGAGTFQASLNRAELEKLAFDEDVASIAELSPQIPLQSGYTDITTLARSAYNHNNNAVPTTAGSGVNASTFENGIDPTIMNCWGVNGSRISQVPIDTFLFRIHSNQTFRCLMGAAPGANLWHRNSSTYYLFQDINWIINNGISSMSMSKVRGDDSGRVVFPNYSAFVNQEFRIMDDFAYRWPYPVFSNPSGNMGYQYDVNWQCYNAVSVGNVRHTNQTHWELVDVGNPTGGCTQTKNPPARYGGNADRELPMLVSPGYAPTTPLLSDACIETVTSLDKAYCGTSLSAPTANGIAADVIAADGRMQSWPEKVRVALLATAQNVDGGYWNQFEDGKDGAGVVDGAGAVAFAQIHATTYPGNIALSDAIGTSVLYASDFSSSQTIDYKIKIPDSKPPGKHLRVVLTWDSNPVIDYYTNEVSDLDLLVTDGGSQYMYSYSWEDNVEMVDIPNSMYSAGSVVDALVYKMVNRIPSGSRQPFFYYAIGWTWVKDHAD
jgi:hypothetical protein